MLKPVPGVIKEWTKAEKQVIELNAHPKLIDLQNGDIEAELLAIQDLIGIDEEAVVDKDSGLTEIVEFLREHFSDFSPEEISHCVKLMIAGIFTEIDKRDRNHYGKFTIQFITRPMIEYRPMRSRVITKYWNDHAKYMQAESDKNQKAPEGEVALMISVNAAYAAYEEYKAGDMVLDAGNTIYDFLAFNKVLNAEKWLSEVQTAVKLSDWQKFMSSEKKLKALLSFFSYLKQEKKELLDVINETCGTKFTMKTVKEIPLVLKKQIIDTRNHKGNSDESKSPS